jgi:hypothetical protein
MPDAPEFANIPGMSKEIRNELVATFDALSHWRDEVETVNERCLSQVLAHTSAVARAMGWPDQAIRTTREHLESAAKAQTDMIDQLVEGWKQQLKSTTAPTAIPRGFAAGGSAFPNAKLEFNPLAPWMLWLQAAEMWQRAWMPDAPSQKATFRH